MGYSQGTILPAWDGGGDCGGPASPLQLILIKASKCARHWTEMISVFARALGEGYQLSPHSIGGKAEA